VVAETEAAIVAWLREYVAEAHEAEGAIHAEWIADAIERGEYRG
jgi:hypothetical protein